MASTWDTLKHAAGMTLPDIVGSLMGHKSTPDAKTPKPPTKPTDIYQQISDFTGTSRSNAGHLLAEFHRQYGDPTAFGGSLTSPQNLPFLLNFLHSQMSGTHPTDPLHNQLNFQQNIQPFLQSMADKNNAYIQSQKSQEDAVGKMFPTDPKMQAVLNNNNAQQATSATQLNNTLAQNVAIQPLLDQLLTQIQSQRQQEQNLWLNGIPNFNNTQTPPWLQPAAAGSTGIGSTIAGLLQQPTTTPTP